MKKDNRLFQYAHFPVGTVCEVQIDRLSTRVQKQIVTVTGLYNNGPNSYCIETTTPGTVTDYFSCNISWVTRIINRGTGPVFFPKQPHQRDPLAEYKIEVDQILGMAPKSKGEYLAFSMHTLMTLVLSGRVCKDDILDYEAFEQAVLATGVVKRTKMSSYFYAYTANKKRLNKVVNQLLRKHLLTKKRAIQIEQEIDAEIERRERERELERDEYRVGRSTAQDGSDHAGDFGLGFDCDDWIECDLEIEA